jgi:hypothetical protein
VEIGIFADRPFYIVFSKIFDKIMSFVMQHLVNQYVGFRRNLSSTEAAHVLGWLHHMDEGSVTNVSEVHAAFIFTV